MKRLVCSFGLALTFAGLLITSGAAKAQDANIHIPLSGPVLNGLTPGGRADFASAGSNRSVKVEAEKVNLPDGTVLTVRVNGAPLGTLSLQAQKGQLQLETAYYATVPIIHSDDIITISSSSGAVILSDKNVPMTTIIGHVELEQSKNRAQSITFQFRPTDGSAPLLRTQTLASNGAYTLLDIPAGTYNVAAKGNKWLQQVQQFTFAAGTNHDVDFQLPAGDANNDNIVDIGDFGILVGTFGSASSDPASGYDNRADFDDDGSVDIEDFGMLVNNYGLQGDL